LKAGGAIDAGVTAGGHKRRGGGSAVVGKKKGLMAGPRLSAGGEKRRRGKGTWTARAAFVGRVCGAGSRPGKGEGGRRPTWSSGLRRKRTGWLGLDRRKRRKRD
jgi:hypothetical protein